MTTLELSYPLQALTLIRPWDQAILNGKNVENRTWKPWPIVVGRYVAIHAGMKYNRDAAQWIAGTLGGAAPFPDRHAGHIVGLMRITSWIDKDGHLKGDGSLGKHPAQQSPWFFGPCGWLIGHTIKLPQPVACTGGRLLWAVPNLPIKLPNNQTGPSVLQQVLTQLTPEELQIVSNCERA